MNTNYLIFILSITYCSIFAQNELFIDGNNGSNPTLYVDGNDGSNPTLYVDGDIINSGGIFQNVDGDVELTGDWTNTVSGGGRYESTGEVKFSNTANVSINGTMDGTSVGTVPDSGLNQFNELKVNTNSTTVDINLNTNVNINNTGNLNFIANGKIVTGSNVLFIRNNSPTNSILGYTFPATNTTVGSNTRYINGNLQRSVLAGTYEYPVGDGSNMIPFRLENVSADADILGNVENGSQAVLNSGILYCDVASHPGTGNGLDLNDASSNTPDGIMDKLTVDINSTKQWNANLISGVVANYDIEIFPGSYDIVGSYSSSMGTLKYLFKDGIPFDNAGMAYSTDSHASLGFDDDGFNNACPPSSEYRINNLNSFSTFRMGGVSATSATLPVELISLNAYGVENRFISVDWATATEINNEGFEVFRSEDGENFKKIGFVTGNGNTNEIVNYNFEDYNVLPEVLYYYKLKQIDFDGNFEYTYTVSASLNSSESFVEVGNFVPNPATSSSHIEVNVSQESQASYVLYDAIGKLIKKGSVSLNEGLNVIPFELDNLAVGMYQATILVGEDTYSRKLNLMK